MSLVDYASSSDDEASEPSKQAELGGKPSPRPPNQPSPPPLNQTKTASVDRNLSALSSAAPPLSNQTKKSSTESNFDAASSVAPRPATEKLPDASLLLNSSIVPVSTGNDHASWVASAVAESASRKRDSNGLPCIPRGKIPRSSLPHTKTVPETSGGMLLPPQLSGKSNVVTEDINKLFVRKYTEPQPGGTKD